MSYEWPLDPQDLFGERYAQMTNTGLPVEDIDAVRAAITDMWADAPGGWVYEWSKLAASYVEAGSHQQAALAYGWAKFPTLADAPKRVAHARQLEHYLLAAPGFGVDFSREVLDLPYRGGTTKVPVHLFAPFDLPDDSPVVLISGGVDSWKMDVHGACVLLATQVAVCSLLLIVTAIVLRSQQRVTARKIGLDLTGVWDVRMAGKYQAKARASRRNRSWNTSSPAYWAGKTFNATTRSVTVS